MKIRDAKQSYAPRPSAVSAAVEAPPVEPPPEEIL